MMVLKFAATFGKGQPKGATHGVTPWTKVAAKLADFLAEAVIKTSLSSRLRGFQESWL